jgi:hypothetical protein
MTDSSHAHEGGSLADAEVTTTEPRAKPLPRRLPLVAAPPDLVPVWMINEALYRCCERLMYPSETLEFQRSTTELRPSPP